MYRKYDISTRKFEVMALKNSKTSPLLATLSSSSFKDDEPNPYKPRIQTAFIILLTINYRYVTHRCVSYNTHLLKLVFWIYVENWTVKNKNVSFDFWYYFEMKILSTNGKFERLVDNLAYLWSTQLGAILWNFISKIKMSACKQTPRMGHLEKRPRMSKKNFFFD